jgi:hypothetical protein
MSTQIGRGYIVGLSGGTLTFSPTLVGSVTYDERSLRLSHNGSITNVKGKGGDTKGLIAVDEFLECAFNFIPYGTSVAAAKVSAQAPDLLAGCTITGLPVVIMGVFTDALNTSADGQPWIYEGGWEVNGTGDGEPWSASFTLRRYAGITSATPIT